MSSFLQATDHENWNLKGFHEELKTISSLPSDLSDEDRMALLSREEIAEKLGKHAEELYEAREVQLGTEDMRTLERLLMLRTVDMHWVHHLTSMDNLRQGIGLHAFGQRDPLVMYKTEGSRMFQGLLDRIQHDIVHSIYQVPSALPGREGRADSRPQSSAMAAASADREKPSPLVPTR